MVTILFAHPWHGSFNKAILNTITEKYNKNNIFYQVIDLNKDNFDPVITEKELALYSTGEHLDPLVTKYQEMLKNTTEMVIIYPIWWMSEPAILRGFFDKVMLKDFAFNYQNGWTTLLNNIKKATVITTSEQETENFKKLGDVVNDFISNSLYSVGVSSSVWHNYGRVAASSNDERTAFLKLIETEI